MRPFTHQHTTERAIHGGVQYLFAFPNGFGASVVRHRGSYGSSDGLWELAVLDGPDGSLTYKTHVTGDVIGSLAVEQVDDLLTTISELNTWRDLHIRVRIGLGLGWREFRRALAGDVSGIYDWR